MANVTFDSPRLKKDLTVYAVAADTMNCANDGDCNTSRKNCTLVVRPTIWVAPSVATSLAKACTRGIAMHNAFGHHRIVERADCYHAFPNKPYIFST